MTFRRKANRHDHWEQVCAQYEDLVESIPRGVFDSEKNFRRFATDGVLLDDSGDELASLTHLSDAQICGLWDFIQNGAKFDMDASLFEAFNAEYLNRNQTRKNI